MEPSTPLPSLGAGADPPATIVAEGAETRSEAGRPDSSTRASTHLVQGLGTLARLAQRFGDAALAEEARAALHPLRENLLRMVALGQFKRGKSSLLNALLEVPILPIGVAPVTSVSTVVRWAPDPCLTVFFEDGGFEVSDIEHLEDFVVDARNPGNTLRVRLVEVGYPAAILEDGLVLVDTPGIGSTDRAATERAYGFLPSVDAGLVVLSPDPPVGDAEATYIRDLAALTPHLLFVLNKVDRVSEAEWREVLSFDRQILADVLQREAADIEIVPVSARRAMEDGDPSVSALRERIEGFIARKGARVREELARRRLCAVAARLEASLDMERHALDMKVRELETRIAGLRETLASLEGRTERAARVVRAAVDDIVGRSGDELLAHARSRSEELAEKLRDTLGTAPPGESNGTVATRFDEALAEGTWAILDAWWERHGPRIVDSLLEEMGRASDDVAQARAEAAEWIRETFMVTLLQEPRVEALKGSEGFYRRVEGVTPRLTMDLLRSLLPRPVYRAWIRRSVPRLANRATDMGAGQVRGDLLYRARETSRAFTAELRAWTLSGMDGLVEAAGRAASLRAETDVAAEARRRTLDDGLRELHRLVATASRRSEAPDDSR